MARKTLMASAAPLLVLLALIWAPAPAAAGPLKFLGLDEALAKSRQEGKFTVLYFWTAKCPYCRYLDQEVLADPEVVADLDSGFVVVSIDKDRERRLAARFRVNSVPRLVFLDPGGEPAAVLPGAAAPPLFRLFLGYVSTNAYKSMGFDEFVERLANN